MGRPFLSYQSQKSPFSTEYTRNRKIYRERFREEAKKGEEERERERERERGTWYKSIRVWDGPKLFF